MNDLLEAAIEAHGGRSLFTPERVALVNGDGTVLEALDQPRASFAGHTLELRGAPFSSRT